MHFPTKGQIIPALAHAILFAATLLSIQSSASLGQTLPQPCPEGLYRDLSSDPAECRYLDFPQFGAQISIPETTTTLTTAQCNRETLNTALQERSASGGGRVLLPACSIEIRIPITVPNNVELRGAGIGKTILYAHVDNIEKLLTTKRRTNIRLADMTLDGYDRPQHNLEIRYSSNVLVEGLEIKRAAGSGIAFYQSRNITIRNNFIHDIDLRGANHGIGSKDCYPDLGDTDNVKCEYRLRSQAESDHNKQPDCTTSYCPCTMTDLGEGPGYCFGYGSLYTQNYIVHSNLFQKVTNEYCTAIHARNGELAGNLCETSGHGSKMPDAWDVHVHNNLFRNNRGWGIHIYGPVKGIHPRRVSLYANFFDGNGDVPVRAEGPERLYVINNRYRNNCAISTGGYCAPGDDYIVNTYEKFADGSTRSPDTYICGGFTEEDVLHSDGKFGPTSPGYAESGRCYSALPVELIAFSATERDQDVELTWTTATETSNSGFEVEHSAVEVFGEDRWSPWQPAGFLVGAGTTTDERSYRLRLTDPGPGVHRYRLRQIDFDGRASVSPAVEVTVDVPDGFRLGAFYPNPFNPTSSTTITVSESQPVRVEVFDASGRLVGILFDEMVAAHRPTRIAFEGMALPSGAYVVRATGRRHVMSSLVTLVK